MNEISLYKQGLDEINYHSQILSGISGEWVALLLNSDKCLLNKNFIQVKHLKRVFCGITNFDLSSSVILFKLYVILNLTLRV